MIQKYKHAAPKPDEEKEPRTGHTNMHTHTRASSVCIHATQKQHCTALHACMQRSSGMAFSHRVALYDTYQRAVESVWVLGIKF